MGRPADTEIIGRNIAGKFVIESFLGGGAMGGVYKAYQRSIEKHVAIKVLHREYVADPTFVSRFEREAKAASLLDHVNLMRVVDYGREPDGICYIAMELLEGRTLFQVLKEEGRLDPARTANIIRQTLAGLALAHDVGIIHRDLKPENVVLVERFDDDGNRAEVVKVCDFGMAKLITPDPEAQGPLSSEKLTSHGVVVGTPDYMSPEQGRGERLDARSDLYSVGVMLYQMLSGRLPFSADTPIATLLRHVVDDPVPPSDIDPDVHPGLEAVCLRALAKRPDDRFQTAREMRAEIRDILDPRGQPARSSLSPQRSVLMGVPDAGPAALDVPATGGAQPLEAGPPRSLAVGSPQSSRIRAVEILRDERPRSRRWTGPLGVVAVALLGALTVYAPRLRRAHVDRGTTGPALAVAQPDVTNPASPPAASGPTPAEPITAAAESDPSRALAADARGPLGYSTPVPGSLAVRGVSRLESQCERNSVRVGHAGLAAVRYPREPGAPHNRGGAPSVRLSAGSCIVRTGRSRRSVLRTGCSGRPVRARQGRRRRRPRRESRVRRCPRRAPGLALRHLLHEGAGGSGVSRGGKRHPASCNRLHWPRRRHVVRWPSRARIHRAVRRKRGCWAQRETRRGWADGGRRRHRVPARVGRIAREGMPHLAEMDYGA